MTRLPKFFGLALAAGSVAAAYAFLVRPWQVRWGATDEEITMRLPGDEFVRDDAPIQSTHAITINAPVSAVWPWLVQIGQNRGGFYSYEWLENLVGCRMNNAERVLPEYQDLKEGDEIWLHPKAPPLHVLRVEKEKYIVLEKTWAFYLRPIDENTTRLIIRGRGEYSYPNLKNDLLNFIYWRLIFEPAHFIMERKMMLTLKERAEGSRA
jgi:hypothetical protein